MCTCCVAFLVLAACKLDLATELLHGELHHPLRRVHRVFELHVDVSEKSFQDQKIASICPLCAKLHHPNPKNKKVMKIYSQLSIKSNPLKTFLRFVSKVNIIKKCIGFTKQMLHSKKTVHSKDCPFGHKTDFFYFSYKS